MELTFSEIIQNFMDFISNPYLVLFFLSMMPITELRLTIPIGIILFKLNIFVVFLICVASNMLIGFFLIYTVSAIIRYAERFSFLKTILSRVIIRSKGKIDGYSSFKRYALVMFVGIPLPGTGAWTGSLVAHVLDLKKSDALLSVALGVVLSGVIMTVLSATGRIVIG